jgi:hypothetical protein
MANLEQEVPSQSQALCLQGFIARNGWLSRIFPIPSFLLFSKVKKMDKVDGPDADKSDWIKLEFLINPDNPASGSFYSRYFTIFKDRFLEEWIKWVM